MTAKCDGTSAVVIENNIAGNTTFYRAFDINSGAAPGVVESNNAAHVVTFPTEGFPPEPGPGVRRIDAAPFDRIEPFGSLISISGTDVPIAAGETIDFVFEITDSQTLVAFVDSNNPSATLSIELLGVTDVLAGAAHDTSLVLDLQPIAVAGTYTFRVTSDAPADLQVILILNAAFERDESHALAIDASLDSGPTAGRWAAIGITHGTTATPDVDQFTVDLTGHAGRKIDVIVTGIEGQTYENQTLELIAPNGTTVLATGTATPIGGSNAGNFDLGILSFVVPVDGIYTARVTAPFDDIAYSLVVSYGLTFEAEPNNNRNSDALRTIASNNLGIGYLDAAADANDFYKIELTAGAVVTLTTAFAHEVEFSPVNTLDPELEVFRPDGTSLIANQNFGGGVGASVTFTAQVSGTYVVRMGATSGNGEYMLRTDVQAPSVLLSLSVAAVSINEGGGAAARTLVTVTRTGSTAASLTVNLASNDSSELTVPATVVIPAGQLSATFTATAENDGIIDGSQIANISATASGVQGASQAITIVDRTYPTLPISVQTVATSRPTFTWTSISNAATYQVFVNNVTTNQSQVVDVTGLTTNSYTPTTDLPIGTYNVWVRGFTSSNLAGVWSPVAVWKLRPTTTMLDSGRTESSGAFSIDWNLIPGASSYDVWVNRVTSSTIEYLRNQNVIGASLDVSGFAIGQYSVWVRARNSAGDLADWSPRASINVSIAPDQIAVTAASLTSTPSLTWQPVGGATKYDVWINNLTTGASGVVKNTSVPGTSRDVSSLPAGSYRAWVRAADQKNHYYAWSSAFDFELNRAPRVTAPVGNAQPARPTITWSAVAGAVRYEMWISNVTKGRREFRETDLTSTSYLPTIDLVSSDTYRVWIQAFDSSGASSGWSAPLTFATASISAAIPDLDLTPFQNDETALEHVFAVAESWLHEDSVADSDEQVSTTNSVISDTAPAQICGSADDGIPACV